MAIDGIYNIETTTPMGKEQGTLTIKTGASPSATFVTKKGEKSSGAGTVTGNDVGWQVVVKGPMGPVKVDYKGTVTGDKISGKAQLGPFGSAPFQGTRT